MKRSIDRTLPELDEVQRRKAALAEEIAHQKSRPEQLRREEEERRTTLPPFDLLDDVVRGKVFDDKVAMGQVKNARRDFARSSCMTLLLLIAAAVVLWWAYRAMERYGLL
jgi:uncharacterized membrane protein YcjF (UPF0283 family)